MFSSTNCILRLILGWVFTATSFFLVSTVTPIYLAQNGFSPFICGAIVSAGWIGTLLACLNAPRPTSPRRHHQLICHLAVLSCLVLYLTNDVWAWFAANLSLGYTFGTRWIYTDAWLLTLAAGKRGRIIGLYEACSGATLFFGPAIAVATFSTGSSALVYALISTILAGIIVCNVEVDDKQCVTKRAGIIKQMFHNLIRRPSVLIACLAGGIFESGSGTPLSLWLIETLQYTPTFAMSLVSVIGIGSFLLQLPFGLASERIGSENLKLASAVILIFSAALLACFPHISWLILMIAFLWGGIGGGLYTLSAISLGNSLSSGTLISAISLAVAGYTLGGIFGPLICGLILLNFPSHGIPLFYLGVAALVLGALLVESRYEKELTAASTMH